MVASVVVFAVMEILPGDPALLMLGVNASPDTLGRPAPPDGSRPAARSGNTSTGPAALLVGNFGKSYTYSSPVLQLIAQRAVVSLPLAVISLVLSTAIAIPVGLFAASRRGRAADTAVMGATQIGVAVPNFWFALILVYVFAVWLRLGAGRRLPGMGQWLWPGIKSLLLPAVALALPQAAILSRVTRSALLEVLGEDYIRTARAKGLPRRAVLWRHALQNALIPVLTILGLQFAFLIAGTIIIENVFYLPGLGRLIFQAITQRDLIVVQGVVIVLVASVIVVNLMVDLAYALVDPRLRRRCMTEEMLQARNLRLRTASLRQALSNGSFVAGLVITLAIALMAARLLRLDALRRHQHRRRRQAADAVLAPLVRHRPFRPRHPVDDHGRRAQLDRGGHGRRRSSAWGSACRWAAGRPRAAACSTRSSCASTTSSSPFPRCCRRS